jgi:hypothetical protein
VINAVMRTLSPAFTFMRSLLLPNALIYEPFWLPSPPASRGEGSQNDSTAMVGVAYANMTNLA